jgi:heme-degrading monooxygenase HmoA
MHAVVIRVTIGDAEVAEAALKEQVVPRASGTPGFVAGYWTRSMSGNDGLSMLVFESEEAAEGAKERMQSMDPPPTVTIDSVEIREVVANA